MSADAADGGVEIVEQLIGDARGDLRAVTPTEHVFVGHDHSAGLCAPMSAMASQS